jgi:hypothetical protein
MTGIRYRLAASIGAALLSAAVCAGSAAAARPVVIASPGTTDGNGSAVGGLSAIYVDSSGAAHIAWEALNGMNYTGVIDECTIPAGGSSCGDHSSLTTAAVIEGNGADISTIKYLAGPNDSEYLAVGISGINLTSETEVFGPGLGSGRAAGSFYDAGGDGNGGDVILEPDASGIDVVGIDNANYDLFDDSNPPGFEFESFTPGATGAPLYPAGMLYKGGPNVPDIVDVTKLPLGQTAVIAYDDSTKQVSPVGMYVQPVAGGAFGPLHPLGISGPVETNFSPSGQTYVLNVQIPQDFGTSLPGVTMELYRFRGTSLKPVASIGLAYSLDPNSGEETWDGLPPTFEDAAGNYYVAWIAQGDVDNCPASVGGPGAESEALCVVYRRITSGGVPGPPVVQIGNDDGKGTAPVVDLGPMAANQQGAGWMLYTNVAPDNTPTLYAQPLASSAAVGTVTASGDAVSAPVTCAGNSSSKCVVSGKLESGGKAADRAAAASAAQAIVYASVVKRLKGGTRTKLVLRLDKAGKKLLARRHRLKLQLLITEMFAGVKKPTPVLAQSVTLGRHRR